MTPRKKSTAGGAQRDRRNLGRNLIAAALVCVTVECSPRVVHADGENEVGPAQAKQAIAEGLAWLAQQQRADGSWSFRPAEGESSLVDHPIAATGLAVMALLGDNQTPFNGKHRVVVERGVEYLLAHMDPFGSLQGAPGHAAMYGHGIATIALCEAVAATAQADPDGETAEQTAARRKWNERVRGQAIQAIQFTENAQASAGGWRYEPRQTGDISVTGWQCLALHAGRRAGIPVERETIERMGKFLDSMQTDEGAAYGYQKPANATPVTSAIGLYCRLLNGSQHENPALRAGILRLAKEGVRPENAYYTFFATGLLREWGGEEWKAWNSKLLPELVRSQLREPAAERGSGPADAVWGKGYGGPLYTTSLNLLAIEALAGAK